MRRAVLGLLVLMALFVVVAPALAAGTAPILDTDLTATKDNILAQVDVVKVVGIAILAVTLALAVGFKLVKRFIRAAA